MWSSLEFATQTVGRPNSSTRAETLYQQPPQEIDQADHHDLLHLHPIQAYPIAAAYMWGWSRDGDSTMAFQEEDAPDIHIRKIQDANASD